MVGTTISKTFFDIVVNMKRLARINKFVFAKMISLVFDPRLEIWVLLGLAIGLPVRRLAIASMAALGLVMTMRWKWRISAHAGVNSALATYVVMSYGSNLVWLYGIVALVGWSRVELGRHGWLQVIAGAILGGVGVWIGKMVV